MTRLVADLPTHELLTSFRERVTTISVRVSEPGEVYDVVERLRAYGVVVESLTQVQPDLEDVFLALMNEPSHA